MLEEHITMQALRRLKNFIYVPGFSTSELMRLYFKSAICTARFRMGGVQSPVVSCDGHLPVLYSGGDIKIGKRFSMRGPLLGCELGAQPEASLEIGDRVFINQGATVVAFERIEIGNDCLIGEFSAIYDSNHHGLDPDHPTRAEPIIIGNNVWLSRGVIVLPGSKIGDHTVVAANSVVKGDLPPCVLAAGNPAQVVRKLDIPEGYTRHETMFSLLPPELADDRGFVRAATFSPVGLQFARTQCAHEKLTEPCPGSSAVLNQHFRYWRSVKWKRLS
jgi:acetyltransferase-like isoleucine patch superfamily enzyme